jgi:hypothetical protein
VSNKFLTYELSLKLENFFNTVRVDLSKYDEYTDAEKEEIINNNKEVVDITFFTFNDVKNLLVYPKEIKILNMYVR